MNAADITPGGISRTAVAIAGVGPVDIWAAPIAAEAAISAEAAAADGGAASPRASRRERERKAVAALVAAAFGHTAELRHEPSGRPFVAVNASTGACTYYHSISISHCADRAMLAVAPEGVAVGIDCEHYRPALRNVARRFLAPGELPLWAADPRLLLRAWTVKEAVYKAARLPGLALDAIALPHPGDLDPVATAAGRTFRLAALPAAALAATASGALAITVAVALQPLALRL